LHQVPVYRLDANTGSGKIVVDCADIWIGKVDNPAFGELASQHQPRLKGFTPQ
jgi:hypothetical protein